MFESERTLTVWQASKRFNIPVSTIKYWVKTEKLKRLTDDDYPTWIFVRSDDVEKLCKKRSKINTRVLIEKLQKAEEEVSRLKEEKRILEEKRQQETQQRKKEEEEKYLKNMEPLGFEDTKAEDKEIDYF